ncbi:MAG: hypothetical protein ACK559_02215, partial [bacterium]
DRLLDDRGEPGAGGGGRQGGVGQDEGEGLRQIAHVRVALLDEPGGQGGRLRRPLAQLHGRDGPQLPVAAEDAQRAGGVVVGGGGVIVTERGDLVVRARRGVVRVLVVFVGSLR